MCVCMCMCVCVCVCVSVCVCVLGGGARARERVSVPFSFFYLNLVLIRFEGVLFFLTKDCESIYFYSAKSPSSTISHRSRKIWREIILVDIL